MFKRHVAAMEPDLQCQSKPSTSGISEENFSGKFSNKNRFKKRVDEMLCFTCNQTGHGCGKIGVIRPNCSRSSKNVRAGTPCRSVFFGIVE